MTTLHETLIPTDNDVLLARQSSLLLGEMKLGRGGPVGMQVGGQAITVPAALAQMLIGALQSMAKGKAVAFLPLDEEMSTQEAAELLNVSRPYAAKLFDQGIVPSRKVGTHRRALTSDVLAYKQKTHLERYKALDELAGQAQELKMGY